MKKIKSQKKRKNPHIFFNVTKFVKILFYDVWAIISSHYNHFFALQNHRPRKCEYLKNITFFFKFGGQIHLHIVKTIFLRIMKTISSYIIIL